MFRTAFKTDSRNPSEVFQDGFKSADRRPIPFSWRMSAALYSEHALLNTTLWIYVVLLDVSDANFHDIQKERVKEALDGNPSNLLHLQEVAVKQVDPKNILFAVSVNPHFIFNKNKITGGTYNLGFVKENTEAFKKHKNQVQFVKAIKSFLDQEVETSNPAKKNSADFSLPNPRLQYHRT